MKHGTSLKDFCSLDVPITQLTDSWNFRTQSAVAFKRTALFFALLFPVLLSGCQSQKAATPSDAPAAAAVPVQVMVVSPRLLEHNISTTGTLLADEEVELRSEISGRIVGLHFREGSTVHKGDLLIKINDRDIAAQLTRKELEEKLAGDEEQRAKKLLNSSGISQEEYDRVLNKLQLIRAENEELNATLARTEIRAPFDGLVGLRSVSEGGYVSPSMPVATLQDVDPIKVDFSVPEKYAGMLHEGSTMIARIGNNDSAYVGTVFAVEAKIDPSTRTIRARASIPNRDRKLIPGSFARVLITLNKIENALVVPSQAIVPQLEGEKVYLVRGGKAAFVSITSGIRTESGVQITDGLNPGDSLVLTGLLQLSNGKLVKPSPYSELSKS